MIIYSFIHSFSFHPLKFTILFYNATQLSRSCSPVSKFHLLILRSYSFHPFWQSSFPTLINIIKVKHDSSTTFVQTPYLLAYGCRCNGHQSGGYISLIYLSNPTKILFDH
mmetsp:Transcript_26332/g.53679  ORF Transcript_26332/g.53679 Transcript_26332/m.53679 type:complete len:110 (+) Transcript_26332:83-412(+)